MSVRSEAEGTGDRARAAGALAVLVVEDDPLQAAQIVECLARTSVRLVAVVADGEEALALLRTELRAVTGAGHGRNQGEGRRAKGEGDGARNMG